MRKHCVWISCIGGMLILFSCKKENIDANTPQSPSNEKLIPKIKSWLDEQKKGLSATSSARIESLETNLSYGEIRLEKYKESKEFIVVPILGGFKSANNSDKNPANYLVLVLENQDSITRGNIIQYISSDNVRIVPENTFSKIFTHQVLDCSGKFTVLNIADYVQYELAFENGKLRSIGWATKKRSQKGESGRANECIDWYWQTWYVWSDGSMTLVSEVFVFTTCDGDCAQPRIANGRSYNIYCSGGGNGGGGGDDACVSNAVSAFQAEANGANVVSETVGFDISAISEVTKNKNPKWRILRGWSGWDLISEEIGVIKLIDEEANHWAWKSLSHGTVTMEGSPPPGASVEYNQGVGTPSFTPETASATTVLYAGMSLNFNVTYRILCDCPYVPLIGQIPPIIKSYNSVSPFWNSKPN